MGGEVSVTQAEIDAAYEVSQKSFQTHYDYEMWLREAFARHRQQATAEAEATIAELRAENARLNKQLSDANKRIERLVSYQKKLEAGLVSPEWFYWGDEQSSDHCVFSVWEAVDFGLDNMTRQEAIENQPFEITTATSLPSIWVTLEFLSEARKDELQTDDEYILTEHATLAEAQEALASIDAHSAKGEKQQNHGLAAMVALDEELEDKHPGWMTGINAQHCIEKLNFVLAQDDWSLAEKGKFLVQWARSYKALIEKAVIDAHSTGGSDAD